MLFFQAHVYVEENPKIQMYWGFYVRADWSKKNFNRTINALVDKHIWGPEQTPVKNPYLELKK